MTLNHERTNLSFLSMMGQRALQDVVMNDDHFQDSHEADMLHLCLVLHTQFIYVLFMT